MCGEMSTEIDYLRSDSMTNNAASLNGAFKKEKEKKRFFSINVLGFSFLSVACFFSFNI